MVLLAQHLARHRLREPRLLEAIAHFLVVQEGQLNSKVGLPHTLLSHPSGPALASLIAASSSKPLGGVPWVPPLLTPTLAFPAPSTCMVLCSS